MNSRTRAILAVVVLSLVPGLSEAQSYRNIAGISLLNYFDGSFALTVEEVFIAPVVPERLQVQVAARNETDTTTENTRSLTLVQTGPIVLFGPHLYGIALYSAGLWNSGEWIHEGELRLTYERSRYLLTAGVRGRWQPTEESSYVVPTVGSRVVLPGGIGLQTNYYFGINTDRDISHAIWSELDYAVSSRFTVKAGGSVELGDDESYSAISGASFAWTEALSLRYQLDYLIRPHDADGLRNIVYLDWRF